jgi:hypothetical protein
MTTEVGSKPAGLTSFKAEHKTWFEDFYKRGIQHTRDKLVEYAKHIQTVDDYDDMDKDKRDEVDKILSSDDNSCPNSFQYPE